MLLAGFRGNIFEKVVDILPSEQKYIIPNSIEGVGKFVEYVKENKPDKVLLLGMYSGKDQDKLRIETVCTNKFRNKFNGEHLHTIPIPHFLKPTINMKLAKGIGNSWCNLVSYNIVSNFPNLSYTFLHVPKNYDVKLGINELAKQIVSG